MKSIGKEDMGRAKESYEAPPQAQGETTPDDWRGAEFVLQLV